MEWPPIQKSPASWAVVPNLADYEETCARFSWTAIRREFEGLPQDRGFNIVHEAVDRHAQSALRNHLAIRWLGKDGRVLDFTYGDLHRQTNRFANLLQEIGVSKAERVFALAGRVPELYIAALGTLKNGSVFCPLFSAFGPEPVKQRLSRGDAKVLVTTERLYRKNVAGSRPELPSLRHVLLLDAEQDLEEGTWSLRKQMSQASPDFTIPPTSPKDMALLHFTSGTTGMPKGAIHVHEAAIMHYVTGKYALDLHPGDIFWCTGDPGWITGTSYGIIAPLLHGVTNIVDEADFDAELWYKVLEEQQVSVWYTAPTAVRMLMRQPIEPRRHYNLSRLRFVSSVGEPLNPAAVVWGQEALGLPIHDNWWQTETGGIMIANFASMEIRPGSMGRTLPGVEAAVVRRSDEQTVEIIREPNAEGELALRPGWPSMFRGYLHDEERYRKCFAGGWYLTGDLVKRDPDGYFTFVGRAYDIIKTAGHMVGPFEVESALMTHPAVAEAGVIGKPEPVIGELVKAFVALKPGWEPSEELKLELIGFARKMLGSVVAPKEITFEQKLPHTRSGKVMRRLLKARELGLPEGDTSTLEESA
ncbi:MAG: acetate--CoA ligase [Acidobacteria bacterium]|nr:acetate--CoA ligase [Acidobacteriota bacterium]